jgi:hypothetical protein
MFAEKKVLIFDKEKIEIGEFITMIRMVYDDNGVLEEDNYLINGIITYVEEDYISYMNAYGNKYRIDVTDVWRGPDVVYRHAPYKILGMRKHVAEGRD